MQGASDHVSPEIKSSKRYTFTTDIFSLGHLFKKLGISSFSKNLTLQLMELFTKRKD